MSYLVADVPDHPVSVLFNLDLVDQLRKLAQGGLLGHGFRGVLFGRTDTTERHRTVVTAEACELVDGLVRIGVVRSWVRGRVYLSKQDRDRIERQEIRPYSILLVVRTATLGVPVAGAFLCESGEVLSERSFVEFPLDRARIASRGFTLLNQAAVPDPAPRKQLVSTRRPIRMARWAWIPISVAMLALLTVVLRHSLTPRDSPSASEPVSQSRIILSLKRDGNDVLLQWDPNNPRVRAAKYAVLRITDRSMRRSVPLDASQLQVGAAQYHPVSDDVEFQMEIPGTNGATSDPVRFISAPPRERTQVSRGLTAETPTTGESDRTTHTGARRLRADQPAVQVQISYEPLSPSALRRAASRVRGVGLFRFRNGGDFVAPRVSHQVTPVVPAATTRRLSGETRLQLRANIDKNGRVTGVLPISAGADEAIVRLTESAILRWQFNPARLHNRPIASSLRFTVRIEKGSNEKLSARR